MRLYMPRFYVLEPDVNLARMRTDAGLAVKEGCDCVIFPEQFITGYYAKNEPERFRREFAEVSGEHAGVLFFFGTISEDGVNRLVVYLDGREVIHYDKIHLFLPNGEGEIWGTGDRYVALRHGDWRIGLATCNDVRFPEQVRELKLKHDINMVVYPALWPWQRDHVWAALLKARAIENGCFVAGSCVAGVNNGHEQFDGAGNHVFTPLGDEVYPAGRVYELNPAVLDQVTVDTREQYRPISRVELIDPNP